MYSINGRFTCNVTTGVERYAYEILKNLDSMILPGQVEIVVPSGGRRELISGFKNIKVTDLSEKNHSLNYWEQVIFPRYLAEKKMIGVNMCNSCPLIKPDIVCVHDIMHKTNPQFFRGKRSRKIHLFRLANYLAASKNAKKIVTVSEFTKKELVKHYHVRDDKIAVTVEGWEHFKRIAPDKSIFDKYPQISSTDYFLFLGQISGHKNLNWILEVAKKNLSKLFVIVGKTGHELLDENETPSNCIFTGYVSDSQVVALMESMQALLFPSFCEGYGIPPMEALALGKKAIVSNTCCMPEIYGDSVTYIDPYNTEVDLDELLRREVKGSDAVLKRNTWENAAIQWKKILELN